MINDKSTPLTLWQFLAKVDTQGNFSDYAKKHYHKVQYNNSRSIIRYLQPDTKLLGYACNPGNGVILLRKKGGIMAYAVIYLGYPNPHGERVFLWSSLKNREALKAIREGNWAATQLDETQDYSKGQDTHNWLMLAKSTIHYVTNYQGDKPLSTVQASTGELSILQLRSGKLRLEMDESYCPCQMIGKALNYFEHRPVSTDPSIFDLPQLNAWSRIVSIDPLPADLGARIKAQAIAETING